MKFVEQNFMNLTVDQYANYLISFLLEKWKNTPEGNKIKKINFSKLCYIVSQKIFFLYL